MKLHHIDPLPEAELRQWCENQLNGSGNSYTARLAARILRVMRERDAARSYAALPLVNTTPSDSS